jgi:hypothetical protein
MYQEPDVPGLERKRRTALRFMEPLGHAERRVGRPRAGWLYNETSGPGRAGDG